MLELVTIIGGTLLRLIPHLPNFSSVSATAIFGGAHMKKRYALFVPLIIMAASDYLLLYINPFRNPVADFSRVQPVSAMFHPTTLYVWASFLISGLIGLQLRQNSKIVRIGAASLISSVQFFLITNFGVFAAGYYGHGVNGLMASYYSALPFFRWTVLGDLFYVAVFFGCYALAKRLEGVYLTGLTRRIKASGTV